MSCALRGLVLLTCSAALFAQSPPARAQTAGLEADWDIAEVLKDLNTKMAQLQPLLDKVDATAWIEKGASETYAAQLQSSREQAKAAADTALALSRTPEKLSLSIELLFRIQALDHMVSSLYEGISKYQTPNDTLVLVKAMNAHGTSRDRLQKYIVNLAAEREHDLEVMDKEAQRCRGVVTQAPPKTTRKK